MRVNRQAHIPGVAPHLNDFGAGEQGQDHTDVIKVMRQFVDKIVF